MEKLPPFLQERYLGIRQIGRGAFGRVVLATDQILEKKVAIKLLDSRFHDDDALGRFQEEARVTSSLAHPHIVQVVDAGADPAGNAAIVYEYVDGENLRSQIAARRPWSTAEVAALGMRLAQALAAAHAAGVVHRDVKPENILVRRGDRWPVLCDFGLARSLESGRTRTRTGMLIGTPAYCAPELWHGKRADEASDQWGLAATLFELLYGEAPWGTADIKTIFDAAHAGFTPAVPAAHAGRVPDLETIVLRGLATDPAARFPDCAALADALWTVTWEVGHRSGGQPLVNWAWTRAFELPDRELLVHEGAGLEDDSAELPRTPDGSTVIAAAPATAPPPRAGVPPVVGVVALAAIAALVVLGLASRPAPSVAPEAGAPSWSALDREGDARVLAATAQLRKDLAAPGLLAQREYGDVETVMRVLRTYADPRLPPRVGRFLAAHEAWLGSLRAWAEEHPGLRSPFEHPDLIARAHDRIWQVETTLKEGRRALLEMEREIFSLPTDKMREFGKLREEALARWDEILALFRQTVDRLRAVRPTPSTLEFLLALTLEIHFLEDFDDLPLEELVLRVRTSPAMTAFSFPRGLLRAGIAKALGMGTAGVSCGRAARLFESGEEILRPPEDEGVELLVSETLMFMLDHLRFLGCVDDDPGFARRVDAVVTRVEALPAGPRDTALRHGRHIYERALITQEVKAAGTDATVAAALHARVAALLARALASGR